MSRKPAKKPAPQGRKSGVVIPPLPELHVHADAIRALARRSFDDIIDIGRRLARCRELLKSERQWMAWLLAEFSWSRRTANRFIALFQAKDKLGNLPTLPMSSLYTLATASPKLIQKIERDIKAGERPSVAEIQQQVRADRLVITATPITPRSMPRLHLTAPPEEPNAERHTIAGDDLLAAEADHQAIDFPQQLAGFARYLDDLLAPDVIAAALPAAKRDTIIADARAIITFLNALNRALWETWSLRVVSDGGDADSTSH